MFIAKYKVKRVTDNMESPHPEHLSRFWIQSGREDVDGDGRRSKVVHRYIACDSCITQEAKRIMKYYPDGWMELSKGEMMSQNLNKNCVIC